MYRVGLGLKFGVMYKKVVTKGSPDYCYLHVRLDFEEQCPEIGVLNFKQIILEAVTSLFGLAGASTLIDILRYDEKDRSAIIRIYHRFLTQFWSSLSLYGNYKGLSCAFRVLQINIIPCGLLYPDKRMGVFTSNGNVMQHKKYGNLHI